MRHVFVLLGVAVSVASGANVTTTDVCTLPAASLFLPAANTSAPLARCWSDSAGMTVLAPCVLACACRRLETANNQQRGVCLNSSTNFRCSDGGGTDCSAYALNADGTSTPRNRGSLETSRPSEVSATVPPAAGADTATADVHKGLAAWLWAVIVVALVLGVGLAVFAISWFRRRSDSAKLGSDTLERTESVDVWKDTERLEAQAAAAQSVVGEAPPQRYSTLNLAEVSGLSAGVGYHTYRIDSTSSGQARLASRPQSHCQGQVDSDDDDQLSVNPESPSLRSRDSYSTARRSSVAGSGERLTGGSRLSYASAGSYGSEMDSFSSQLTLEESEPRDTEPASDANYHEHQRSPPPPPPQRFFGGASNATECPRKKSTEF